MNEFLEIVKERPDKKLKKHKCPFCKKKNVQIGGMITTLVGGDNHEWTDCRCGKCGESYIFEQKGSNKWITQDRVVKFGIPTCFESYIYSCNKCGGQVCRHQWEKDKDVSVRYISYTMGSDEKNYRNVFKCDDCGVEIESTNDYYCSDSVIKQREKNRKNPQKLDPKWTLEIGEDIAIINNIDLESEMECVMSEEVVKEIDQQLSEEQQDACMDGFIYGPYIPKTLQEHREDEND